MAKKMDLSTKLAIIGTAIALILLLYYLYDRYVTGKIVVEFNEGNVMVLPSYGITGYKKDEGALSICILNLNVNNLTNRTKTIKSVQLKYEFKGNEYIIDSSVLPTGADRANVNSLVIRNAKGYPEIVKLDWKNLRPEIYKYQSLPPEGILSGSTLFVLLNCKMSDYKNIKNVKFLITDSKNEVYKQKFELKDKYSQGANKGYFYSQIN
jgi:hypothetical protein